MSQFKILQSYVAQHCCDTDGSIFPETATMSLSFLYTSLHIIISPAEVDNLSGRLEHWSYGIVRSYGQIKLQL